jgi:hypothetical protein
MPYSPRVEAEAVVPVAQAVVDVVAEAVVPVVRAVLPAVARLLSSEIESRNKGDGTFCCCPLFCFGVGNPRVVRRPPQAAYRSDPEGGPDAKINSCSYSRRESYEMAHAIASRSRRIGHPLDGFLICCATHAPDSDAHATNGRQGRAVF